MSKLSQIVTQYNEKYACLWSMFLNFIELTTESTDKYLTLDDLERKIYELNELRYNLNDELVSKLVSNLEEKKLIKVVKENYKKKSILLRTNAKFPITIQTIDNKITINRYMLSPIGPEDKRLLWETEQRKNIYPIDRFLNIENLPFRMSVDVMLKVSKVAQYARSFKDAAEQLSENCRIKLDPITITSVTKHIGNIAFNYEMEQTNKVFRELEGCRLEIKRSKIFDGVCYIQVDGAMVNTRNKGEDGSGWRENKLGLVYTSDNVRVSRRIYIKGKYEYRHRILKKGYTSYIGEAAIFKKLLFNCAINNGYGLYKEVVLISDGAKWIRNIKDELFPEAIQILDYYHLCEKIWDFSKLIFKKNQKKYTPWAIIQCEKLKKSKYNDVLKEILKLEQKHKIVKETISQYISSNLDIIDYELYLNKNYIIGSGAIESSNKTVLQSRLKQPGMQWHIETAQSLVTLRAKKESGRWEEDVVKPVKKFYNIII
jgi:hypothetical protein